MTIASDVLIVENCSNVTQNTVPKCTTCLVWKWTDNQEKNGFVLGTTVLIVEKQHTSNAYIVPMHIARNMIQL